MRPPVGPCNLHGGRLVSPGEAHAHLHFGPPFLDVPRLVLHAMELEADRVPRVDEDELADVLVRLGPDELPTPRFLHSPRGECEPVEPVEVRRVEVPRHLPNLTRGNPWFRREPYRAVAGAAKCSCARRKSFGVLTVSHSPSC